MSDLYLILHKVRGQPAFDIAERCDEMGTESDPGCWWIIPTSGHRAYPYQQWALDDLKEAYDPVCGLDEIPAPPNWPDHYAPSPIQRATTAIGSTASSLLASLGLNGSPVKRKRIK